MNNMQYATDKGAQGKKREKQTEKQTLHQREQTKGDGGGGGGQVEGWVKSLLGMKEGTFDEDQVWYASVESLNFMPETNITPC